MKETLSAIRESKGGVGEGHLPRQENQRRCWYLSWSLTDESAKWRESQGKGKDLEVAKNLVYSGKQRKVGDRQGIRRYSWRGCKGHFTQEVRDCGKVFGFNSECKEKPLTCSKQGSSIWPWILKLHTKAMKEGLKSHSQPLGTRTLVSPQRRHSWLNPKNCVGDLLRTENRG